MKKIITAILLSVTCAAPTIADAHPDHGHVRWHSGPGILAPLVIGGILGGVIVESTRPQTTVVPPPTSVPVYNGSTVVVTNYYDPLRGQCEQRETFDYYGNLINRQITCYGR